MYSLTCPDFGEIEVDALCTHFQPVLNSSGVCVELIPDQWLILKTKIYAEQENLQSLSWSEVNRKHGELCPDVLDLMDLVMSIPVSTADCERGFNTMKQVKSLRHTHTTILILREHQKIMYSLT